MSGDNFVCGLTCNCDTLPGGQRMCVIPGSPNAPREPQPSFTERVFTAAGITPPEPPSDADTYTVIARVLRLKDDEQRAHSFKVVGGITLDEARARAVEAGTMGVFDDLLYYPPSKLLTVRLSREA